MSKYKVGDIFYDDAEYSARAQFCNENNLMIVEIEPDSKGERLFQIRECPPPSKEDLVWMEIMSLKEELTEVKYDIEQVELFGMERADYTKKKTRAVQIVKRLRELNKEVQNG